MSKLLRFPVGGMRYDINSASQLAYAASIGVPRVTGFVYVLWVGQGFFKIGASASPIARAQKLGWRLVHAFPCDDHMRAEASIHAMLDRYRSTPDWVAGREGQTEVFHLPDDISRALLCVRGFAGDTVIEGERTNLSALCNV